MSAAPGAPQPAPLPSGKQGPGKGGARTTPANFNSPLYQPSQQLQGQQLSQAATNIANAQTQGPITELAKQIAQLNGQGAAAQSQTFGYYMQLAKEAQDAVNQEKGLSSGLSSQLQGIGQDTSHALAGFGQQAQGGALGRLSALGLGGDQQAQLQGETAREQGLGALNAQTFRSAGATQGANYTGNAISNLGTNALRGQERLGNIAQATRLSEEPLNAKIAGLQAEKGALYGTALGQLRSQERNYQIAQDGLGIKQQGLQQTAAQNQAKNALTARGQDITARGQDITRQNDLANQALHAAQLNQKTGYDNASLALKQAALNLKQSQSGKAGGLAKPLSTSQQNTLYRNLDEMMTLIGSAQQAGHTEQQIRQSLQTGSIQKGFPAQSAILVQAAYELLGWGHLTPTTAQAMRSMGLRGGMFRGKPIGVGAAPKNPGILGLGSALGNIGNAVGNALGG